ncbi:hypothetical protein [Ferviditalea candida]|uniref:Uncharacterized protein n=1 Tax=Ferviditalea candida TaxID=3108399 RepID=A0ABU5ZNX1_9BACL|nr:hypothetical protein [Paenibacillaceae bacterium T2]
MSERLKDKEPQQIRAELMAMKEAAHEIARRMNRMLEQQQQRQPNRTDKAR